MTSDSNPTQPFFLHTLHRCEALNLTVHANANASCSVEPFLQSLRVQVTIVTPDVVMTIGHVGLAEVEVCVRRV